MKNLTIALNAVLVVAVAVLFYLHFSGSKAAAPATGGNNAAAANGFRIAYFEMDSIENKFDYFIQIREGLRKVEQQKTAELNSLKSAYLSKLKGYQEKGQTMTQTEQANATADLQQMERNYSLKEQAASQELQDEQLKKLTDVKKKIEDYLKVYNAQKGYAYIFSSAPEFMYFKDTVYNITDEVVKGLNQQYKKN
ncbi:MAG: OmpH family outer membrane protein [Chitinophagales bacterium]|mgnify:FL=1|nr:OmpH family outer membrane protein [Chitinophagales bacterium]